jgi:hypothetical protein
MQAEVVELLEQALQKRANVVHRQSSIAFGSLHNACEKVNVFGDMVCQDVLFRD